MATVRFPARSDRTRDLAAAAESAARFRAAAVAGLLLLGACSGAGVRQLDGRCDDAGCRSSCAEGALECHGQLAAVCRDGTWIERNCPAACRGGRCVECGAWERRCRDAGTAEVCTDGMWVQQACDDARCEGGLCVCSVGEVRCREGARETCQSPGSWRADPCPDDQPVCASGRCALCAPGSRRCHQGSSEICAADESWTATDCPHGCDAESGRCLEDCEPGQSRCRDGETVERCDDDRRGFSPAESCEVARGWVCDDGACVRPCDIADDPSTLAPASCRFFAPPNYTIKTPSPPHGQPAQPFYFYVVNPHPTAPTIVTLERDEQRLASATVPPSSSAVIEQPGGLQTNRESVRTPAGALLIRSVLPVYVVQYHHAVSGTEESWSGDSAFLLPAALVETYGTRYRVVSQPHAVNHKYSLEPTVPQSGYTHNLDQPGGFTVLSVSPRPAQLTMVLTAPTAEGAGLPSLPPGANVLTLQPSDVIHFLSIAEPNDLTGSLVTSDEPIAIFNGGMSRIPYRAGAHTQTQLLEQLMPVDLWGTDHVAAARRAPQAVGPPRGDEQWVVMTDVANQLTFEPTPPDGVATRALAAGQSLVFNTASGLFQDYRAFRLRSTEPIMLARYFYSIGADDVVQGHSEFSLERPVRFWRSHYHVQPLADFGADPRYGSRVLLVVPSGASVSQNGQALASPEPLTGVDGFGLLEVDLARGVHRLESDQTFAILVYGWPAWYGYSGPVGFADGL